MSTKTEAKDTFPKFDAVQNPFTAFDPSSWMASQQTFQKMMHEAYERTQAWADEYAAIETQMFARARTAIDTWAQLARDSIAYSEQLSAQARKLSFEAVRRASNGV